MPRQATEESPADRPSIPRCRKVKLRINLGDDEEGVGLLPSLLAHPARREARPPGDVRSCPQRPGIQGGAASSDPMGSIMTDRRRGLTAIALIGLVLAGRPAGARPPHK